jgi:serine/threonine-protein kinase RsbW
MAELPNVRLEIAGRPENVVLVREMLTGLAQTIDLGEADLSDVRTAVTEACNNVVLHAYEDGEGPLQVEVHLLPGTLEVAVCDRGSGLGPWTDTAEQADTVEERTFGIGLPVIRALVRNVEFRDLVEGGTEVRMQFGTPRARILQAPPGDGVELPVLVPGEALARTVLITIAPPRLAGGVLPRLLSALAARAHFSTDRICDVQLVADALVANAPDAVALGYLNIAVAVAPRRLDLRVGPLRAGRSQQLIAASELDGLGRVIEKLTDRHHVEAGGAEEMLVLRMVDQR